YPAYGHVIDRFYPLGSLKTGYFRTCVAPHGSARRFALCLISTWDDTYDVSGNSTCEFVRGMIMLDDFLIRYVEERKVSLCIAIRTKGHLPEREYYTRKFGDHATLIEADEEKMASYSAIDSSDVSLAICSTLAREAFGWGRKVLFCNFSMNDQFDLPVNGIWSLKERDYEIFSRQLDELRAISQDEYRRLSGEAAAYMMNIRENCPAHVFLRNMVEKNLRLAGDKVEYPEADVSLREKVV
ncbi:MAG: hypothetical protein HQL22_07080, partial [Candidatus Omnitrophica bacterium]|nr:hypothetical protein [Candidatus Omnitrophota bacterium]